MDNNKLDKQLDRLFKEVALTDPSPAFLDKVMGLVEQEAQRRKQRERWAPVLQIAAGVAGIVFLPSIIIYVLALLMPGFSFSFSFPVVDIKISLTVISIALAVFMLLVGDGLLHKHFFKKRIKQMANKKC